MLAASPLELLPVSQCDKCLEFETSSHWPLGLPAIAIGRVLIAGFNQALVLNHRLPESDSKSIQDLITSLYPELSFLEAATFRKKALALPWVPITGLLEHWGFRWTDQTTEIADRALALPAEFRRWLIAKRVSPAELTVLLSNSQFDLTPFLQGLLAAGATRQQGTQALELGIELQLLGHQMSAIVLATNESTENWLLRLKTLRYPETTRKDQESRDKMRELPWPGQSQVRWVRQGDRSGLELKLFVANPSDLRKSLLSLQKIQLLLEKNPENLWPEQ